MILPLPEGVSPLQAANAADNLADAWRLVVPALIDRPGAEVLILGGGGYSIGLWAAELAVAHGASLVHYVDTDAERLHLAEESGAIGVERGGERRYPHHEVTVDVTSDPAALACCLRSTAPDGVCLTASMFWDDVALPLLEMYSKNVTLLAGRPHSRAITPGVLDLIVEGRIDPLRIVTTVSWEDVPLAALEGHPKLVVER